MSRVEESCDLFDSVALWLVQLVFSSQVPFKGFPGSLSKKEGEGIGCLLTSKVMVMILRVFLAILTALGNESNLRQTFTAVR